MVRKKHSRPRATRDKLRVLEEVGVEVPPHDLPGPPLHAVLEGLRLRDLADISLFSSVKSFFSLFFGATIWGTDVKLNCLDGNKI